MKVLSRLLSYNNQIYSANCRLDSITTRLGNIQLLSNTNRNYNSIKMNSTSTENKIAICHMKSTNNKEDNMSQVLQIIDEAKNQFAKFVFFPECCDFVGENRTQTFQLSEPLTGPLIAEYKNLAKSNEMWLSFGGVHEAILDKNGEKTGKIYNSHVIINDLGEIVSVYRKLHLFDVDTPDFKFRESEVVKKGPEIIKPVETPIGKIGMLICYDLRFPEASTILRKLGAEILTYPSAFAYSTGKAHWESLLRSRAIENQCYVIAPAQIGFHNKKRQSFGHAMVVDPWGKIIAECSNDKELDIAFAEIDLNLNQKIKGQVPCFEHRRNDVYSLVPIKIQADAKKLKFAHYDINPKTIFYESLHSFAFTNIRCVVPGHVLIATKRITPRLSDLNTDEISDLFQTVVKIQKLLEPLYEATSSTVTCQDGPDAGQTVKHVHIHVMPRRSGDFEHNDMIYIELNKHDTIPDTPTRDIADMIREAEKYRCKLLELS